jgi:MoaA/NifB/PqqE/SkfB family radical SAM enzyme
MGHFFEFTSHRPQFNERLRELALRALENPLLARLFAGGLCLLNSPVWLAGIMIELVNRCNADCKMCCYGSMTRPQGAMSIELFKRIVDQSRAARFPVECLAGLGEPLLYPYLEEALKYFKAKGFGQGMVLTNGILLDDARIGILVSHARAVRVSVLSTDPAVYTALTRRDEHPRLCENVRSFIKRSAGSDVRIQIMGLSTRLNPRETVEGLRKLFGEHSNVSYFIKAAQVPGPGSEDLRIHPRPFDRRGCWNPHRLLAIMWNGDCLFCCFDTAAGQDRIGNIGETDLMRIWRGERAARLRRELRKGHLENLCFCARCPGPL